MSHKTWLKGLLRRVTKSSQPHARKRHPFSPVNIEILEDRSVPATLDWTGAGANANWSTPGNWSQNQVPSATNNVLNFGGSAAVTKYVATNDIAGLTGITINITDASTTDDFAITGVNAGVTSVTHSKTDSQASSTILGLAMTGAGATITDTTGSLSILNTANVFDAASTVNVPTGANLTVSVYPSSSLGAAKYNLTGGTLTVGAASADVYVNAFNVAQNNRNNDVGSPPAVAPLASLGTDVQPYPMMADISRAVAAADLQFQTNTRTWGNSNTYFYSGEIFFPNSNNDGTGSIAFAGATDDSSALYIDDVQYYTFNNNTSANSVDPNTFLNTVTLPTGWHTIDLRFGNGTGGAGVNNNGTTGATGWVANTNLTNPLGKGFGYRVTDSSATEVSAAPKDAKLYRRLFAAPNLYGINAITQSGNTVTVTTAAPGTNVAMNSSVKVGDKVTIAGVTPAIYNGVWTVAAVSGNTFTYTHPQSGLPAGIVNPSTTLALPDDGTQRVRYGINAITASGTTVTVTTAAPGTTTAMPSGVQVGDTVVINGITGVTAYNGTWTVTGVTGNNTFTFTHPTSGLAAGTVNAANTTVGIPDSGVRVRVRGTASGTVTNAVSVSGNSTIALDPSMASASLGNLTMASGANLSVVANNPAGQTLAFGATSLAGNVTFSPAAGATLNLVGVVSQTASAGITKTGAGTLTLSSTNTYAGPTTISAGTVNANANGALGTATGAADGTTVAPGGQLVIGSVAGITYSTAEVVSINGTGTTTTNGALSSPTTSTFAGPITLTGNSWITSSANTLTLSGGITTVANQLTLAGAGTITETTTGITGTGNLVKAQGGTANLSIANPNFTGNVNVLGGTLIGGVSGSFGAGAAPIAVSLGGALGLAGGATYNITKPLSIAGNGPDGNGALTNVTGTTTATFNSITLTENASIGARAGDFTVTNDITIGPLVSALSFSGAGNVIASGKISDAATVSNLYYVGFTGATGGENAQQRILNWNYTGASNFNYSSGFGSSSLTLNGNASIQGTALQLTPQFNNQTGSAFATALAGGNFNTSFQFQLASSSVSAADGFAFVIQNTGLTAIGGGGGNLGYNGLNNSIAVEINMYNDVSNFGVGKNGAITHTNDLTPFGIDFHALDANGLTDVFQADIAYDASTQNLKVTFKDVTQNSTPQSFDFPSTTIPSSTPSGLQVIKNGNGRATLTNNANSYTGTTTINTGTLAAGAANAFGATTNGVVVGVNGSLGLSGNITLNPAEPISATGAGFNGLGVINNVSGNNTIEIPLLKGNTTIGSAAGTLTVGGAGLNLSTYALTVTGVSDTLITAPISESSNAVAGLSVGQTNVSNDGTFTSNPNPAFGSDIDLTPTMGNKSGNDAALAQSATKLWATNDTWFYRGQMFWPNSNGNGTGTLSFAENVDDSVYLWIDGVQRLNNTSWNTATSSGGITLPTGWHDIDLRFSNGGGGAGANNAQPGWSATKGFGYRINTDPNDPLATSTNGDDYIIPTDDGTGNLFRGPIAANSIIKTGTGILHISGANTIKRNIAINGGTLVPDNIPSLGSVSTIVADGGALGMPAVGGLTLPATVTLSLKKSGSSGAGALVNLGGANTVLSPIKLAGDAAIGSNAGTLTVSGPIDLQYSGVTFTGAADIVVNSVIGGVGAPTTVTGISETIFNRVAADAQTNINGYITATVGADDAKGVLLDNLDYANDAAVSARVTTLGGVGFDNGDFSALWLTTFTPDEDGAWGLRFANEDDNASLWIDTDGTPGFQTTDRIYNRGCCAASGDQFTPPLVKGTPYQLGIIMSDTGGGGNFTNMQFMSPSAAGITGGNWVTINAAKYPATFRTTLIPNNFVSKTGAGKTTLTAANTYAGSTTISGGILVPANNAALGANNSVVVNGSGALGLSVASGATIPATKNLSLLGQGPNGAGAILNLDGANTVSAPITLAGDAAIGSNAGTLTIAGAGIDEGRFALTVTGAGDTTISVPITSLSSTVSPGLVVGQSAVSNDGAIAAVPNPIYGSDIDLGFTMGNKSSNDAPVIATNLKTWATNNTWFYKGQIFWPNSNGNGTGTLSFGENVDDSTYMWVDGVQKMNNTAWNVATTSGPITLATGWHNIEVRFSNGGGGAGANNSQTGWTATKGFGYRIDKDPVATGSNGAADPLASSINGNDYTIITDDGTGSTFRTGAASADSLIKTGSGTLNLNAANTFSRNIAINGGTLLFNSLAALGSSTTISTNGGSLGLPAAGGFTLPASISLSLAGQGANGAGAILNLGGANTVSSPIKLTGDAAIGANAGTLTVNGTSIDGSFNALTVTGAGDTIISAPITGVSKSPAGLVVGQTAVNNDSSTTSAPNPIFGSAVDVGFTMGNSANGSNNNVAVPFPTVLKTWTNSDTWFYKGQMFWPNSNGNNTGTLSFAENVDDSVYMWVDGVQKLNNTAFGTPTSTGPITLPTGWHNVEVRFSNGGGGAGPNAVNTWTTSKGFGYRIDKDPVAGGTNGAADPLASSIQGVDYTIVTDDGTGSTFRTAAVSADALVKTGTGTLSLSGNNTYTRGTSINLVAGAKDNQVKVTGPVNLTGGSLQIASGFALPVGNTFTLINNDATDAVTGTFNGLAEGGVVTSGPSSYTITYKGGDGNDVVLTATTAGVATTTSLVASPLATTGGSSVQFTATVAPTPGALGTVTFLDNGVAISGGSNIAVVNGVAIFSTTTLAVGTHPVTASYSGAAGFAPSVSTPQSVVITAGGGAPSVVSVDTNVGVSGFSGAQHSRVINLTVVFDQAVQLDTGAMALALYTNNVTYGGAAGQPTGAIAPSTLNVVGSTDKKTWTITFDGVGTVDTGSVDGLSSLKEGVYKLTVDATKVHPLGQTGVNMAANSTTVVHRLYGDVNAVAQNGNDFTALVNTADNLTFRGAFNKTAGTAGYLGYLDSNGDGTVNTLDNLAFRQRFNKNLTWTV